MIDEEELCGLLAEYAETIPVPDSAIDALLAASPRVAPRSVMERLPRPSARMLAAAVSVVVAAAGVWALTAHPGGRGSVRSDTAAGKAATKSVGTAPGGSAFFPPGVSGGSGAGTRSITPQAGVPAHSQFSYSTGGTAGTLKNSAPTATATGTQSAAKDDARVVRTGTLDVRIARGEFGQTIGRITTIAADSGGFVADAQTFESAATPTGTVKVRVPSARFNTTVNKLRLLGKVVSATTRGVDVSDQYTDLQARLHAASATRDQYLVVLGHATNIGDILAVQDRIQAVQTSIDQFQGKINELDDQTNYGSITMSVTEPGPKAKPVVRPHRPSGMSVAWGNARNGFSRRIEGIISHSGSALVIVSGLLLLGALLRLLLPRMRRLLV